MILFFTFLLFSSSTEASLEDLVFKRSWSRRLITEGQLQMSPVSQTLKPTLLPKKQILQGSSFGDLFLINRYGRKKLIYSAPEGLSGSPSIIGDYAFIGLQNKAAMAINYKTKEVLWKTQLDSAVTALSDVKNGLIFLQTESGSLYALSSESGSINWKAQYRSTRDLNVYGDPKPILVGSDLVAGFESGHVVKFKQKTGKIVWAKQLPGGQKYSDVQYLHLGKDGHSLIAGVFDEAIYKLDLITGVVQWRAFDKPVGDFGFDRDHIYFSSATGEIIKLRQSTGTLIKKAKIFKGVGGTPIVLDKSLIIIDSKGPVYQIDKKSFENKPLYEFFHRVSAKMSYDSSLNALYILTNKGYLFRMRIE